MLPAARLAARSGRHLSQSRHGRRDAAARAGGAAGDPRRDGAAAVGVPAARGLRTRRRADRPADARARRPRRRWRRFVGARPDDVVFVDNATTGANAVLRSIALEPGDEILLTDHTLRRRRERRGVRRARARRDGAHRPRAVSGVRSRRARRRGRGGDRSAHAHRGVRPHHVRERARLPDRGTGGAVPRARRAGARGRRARARRAAARRARRSASTGTRRISTSGRARRAGAASCGPRPRARPACIPPVISWGLDKGFTAEFDWVGTRDPSAVARRARGPRVPRRPRAGTRCARYNHDLAWRGAMFLADRWGTTLGVDEASVGFMATSRCRQALGGTPADAARVRDALLFEHRIEVQVHAAHGRLWTRISAQVYNEWADVERLAQARPDECDRGLSVHDAPGSSPRSVAGSRSPSSPARARRSRCRRRRRRRADRRWTNAASR